MLTSVGKDAHATLRDGGYPRGVCGIAGYVGPRGSVEVVFDQLKPQEYRGYDSTGIAYLNGVDI